MVPGSTLRHGSSLMVQTLAPRPLSTAPIEAVGMPLPTDETTPPVTNIYSGITPFPPPYARRYHGIARRLTHTEHDQTHRVTKVTCLDVQLLFRLGKAHPK